MAEAEAEAEAEAPPLDRTCSFTVGPRGSSMSSTESSGLATSVLEPELLLWYES